MQKNRPAAARLRSKSFYINKGVDSYCIPRTLSQDEADITFLLQKGLQAIAKLLQTIYYQHKGTEAPSMLAAISHRVWAFFCVWDIVTEMTDMLDSCMK